MLKSSKLKSYLIKSKIIRQASVTLPPYDTALSISGERLVEKVSCTCVYNQSGKCKHVAALIYFINNEESLTQTSHEQQWGKPSIRQFVKDKYSKGRNFAEMFPPKKVVSNRGNEQPSVDLQELVDASALKLVLVADQQSKDFYTIKKILSSLITTVDLNIEQEDCKECLRNFSIFNEECTIYSSQYKLEKHIENFYLKNIVMSDEDILKVCSSTINQSQCPEWYETRRLRLSASSNIHSIKVRSRKSIDKLVNDILYPANVDTESTNYGLSHETSAKDKYIELNGCEVKKVGVIVSNKQPWLCASIDGVVVEDGCVIKLVEFKCPIKCKDQPVIDHGSKSSNVKYLNFINDKVELKENDPYYTQIQVQLYVTGMFTCDLFIYSRVHDGCFTVPVYRDELFLEEIILSGEFFYFRHYLSATYLAFNAEKKESTNDSVALYGKRSFTEVNVINNM